MRFIGFSNEKLKIINSIAPKIPSDSKLRKFLRKYEDAILGYTFLLPDIVGLFIFWSLPMIYVFYLSFFDWDLIGDKIFIGLDNYINLFNDGLWWHSLWVTVKYLIVYVPLVISIALFFAVLLTKKTRGINMFRTIYFIPYSISLVIVGAVWAYIFEPRFGIVNYLLETLGIPAGQWLSSADQALWVIVFVASWKYMGYYMILFIAGLQEIPKDYYEAASIDGAGKFTSFRYITLPSLKPVLFFVLVICIIHGFEVFELVYTMTQGGPNNATYISMLYVYEQAFLYFDFGYASAMSFMLFVIIFIVTMFQYIIFRQNESN